MTRAFLWLSILCTLVGAGCSKKHDATPAATHKGAQPSSSTPPAQRSASGQQIASVPPAPPTAAVKSYLGWVSAYHADPAKAAPPPECYTQGTNAGWCSGALKAGSGHRYVQWQKSDPSAAQFASEPFAKGLALACSSIGATRIRKWHWAATDTIAFHCRFDKGKLRGWQAWIGQTSNGTFARVFTANYLKHQKIFANALEKQGKTLP